MPNYNYRSNDCMRRGQYQRPVTPPPVKLECECECSAIPIPPKKENCISNPLHSLPVAMAYVPWQEWQNLYSAEKGFCKGTIFEDLDKPFIGTGGCCK